MMISKRRDCRLMMCTTVLHGGVCHRTSTPHKNGNKMKKKKKKGNFGQLIVEGSYNNVSVPRYAHHLNDHVLDVVE